MVRLKLFSAGLLTAFILTGCLSAPELVPPQQVPPYVRTIKYIRLYGYETKKDTGIDVTEGEPLSILAKGTVYLNTNTRISPGSANFIRFIDDPLNNGGFSPWHRPGLLSPARSGRLYLGIKDDYPKDNSGYFDVTIIVWREKNFSNIYDFLTILHEKDPDNFGIQYALYSVSYVKKLDSAKAETAEAVEATRKQIQEIQKEDQQTEQVPAYVRTIKYIRLYGYETKKDTGVDVTEGEPLSILAKGTVYLSEDADQKGISPGSNRFGQFIGDALIGFGFTSSHGGTLLARRSGRLYIGIRDDHPDDNIGHFDVTIIVWREKNFSNIADFLNILHQKDPDHLQIKFALQQAATLKEFYSAKVETAEAIESTQKQIQEIQQEDHQKASAVTASRDKRMRELEARLADLTAKLKELDNLSHQLQQESQKAAELSRMLEEKEGRERELMSKLGEGVKVAPLLLITSPEHELRTEADSVRLSGAAEDDIGLVRLEVFVNGQSVPDAEPRGLKSAPGGAPRRINFERQVRLLQGENYIQIKVTDTDGLTAERRLVVHYSPSRRNAWAVVVGINRYPRMPQLKYAVNDAREFYRLLVERNRVPAENITLLLDEQATLRNLRSALGTGLKAAAGTRDMVLIFFAGHGATERDATSTDSDGLEKYLLAWDTDTRDLYSSALPMREIAHIFERIRSERLVFIADTCYSGASGGRTVGIGGIRSNMSDMFLERVVGGRGKVIITASAANEVSVERDELQHGVFTYYLLEGLRGAADTDRDGVVTVNEIYRYVSEKVPRATGQEQNPVMKGSVEGSLVMSLLH